ncbi:MarR family winged helix-turn-helix transcriptional regulator [Saccharomonospora piscinae]|uniref:MarR family winged helix-turn-helix transcriptional regulator n=1 Tax=Saccharomonospora piscinae TaxID=687388 RepID=UPI001ABED511|nr:MarR family transcriptional regulator [Saccharomonospora piscinae]
MERIALRLREFVVATDEYRKAMATAAGMGTNEATTLGEILHQGPLPPSALVKRLGITSASVTALLDRLEAAGMVERRAHDTDRRSVLVSLTARGHGVVSTMFAMFDADVMSAVREASPEHIAEFSAVLGRISAGLRARAHDADSIVATLSDGSRTRPSGSPEIG